MQTTRVLRFGLTQVALGGRQPYGMKPTRTRKRNEKERAKPITHIRYILRKYHQPRRWSGLDIAPQPYYPAELIPTGLSTEEYESTTTKE